MLRTLRSQIILLVFALLGIVVTTTVVVLSYHARQSILAQVESDAGAIAGLIGNATTLAGKLPNEIEGAVGEEMLSTASAVAHYVAAAERARLPRAAINETLRQLIDATTIDEIWVTDSNGYAYLHAPSERGFQFSPDSTLQPQASEFWPLLTGEATVVVQPAMRRELDGREFKYAGVAGIDKPRIVQVGATMGYIRFLRQRVGVERLVESLVRDGHLRALLVVDRTLQPLAYVVADAHAPRDMTESERADLQHAFDTAQTRLHITPDAIEVSAVIRNAQYEPSGAFLARFPRSGLDRLLDRQWLLALALGATIFVLGALVSVAYARRLTRPLTQVTRVAAAVGHGDFSRLNDIDAIARREDEIGRLGAVFQSMAREIEDREHVLEQLVQTRTGELAARNADLEAARATIDEELELARRLQFSIVPAEFPDIAHCSGAARMLPATHMGGDFYDFIPLPDGRLGLVMADVAGKGVAAAFMMAVARTRLLTLAREHGDPAACLAAANAMLCANNPLTLFITLFYGILDPRTGALQYANGGHHAPLILGRDGTVRALSAASGMALGLMPDLPYTAATERLEPGDLLLLYTDGVTEAFDAAGNPYGEARLQALLARHAPDTPADIVAAVFADVEAHEAGAPQSDDITLAAIRWQPAV